LRKLSLPELSQAGLRRRNTRTSYSGIQVLITPVSLPIIATGRRIDSGKIVLSWHAPSQTVWLNFGNGDIARRVHRRFGEGNYKILGRTITAVMSDINQSTSGFSYNPVAWSVRLQNVPQQARKRDVLDSLQSDRDQPRHIEMKGTTDAYDPGLIPVCMKSLLDSHGRNEVEFAESPSESGRCKARAHFEEETNARKIKELLH